MIDDIGDVTGSVANGGRTDDTMPTFNGTGTPGNTIEIWDGETLLGEVLVDDEGNWTFTPENRWRLAITASLPPSVTPKAWWVKRAIRGNSSSI